MPRRATRIIPEPRPAPRTEPQLLLTESQVAEQLSLDRSTLYLLRCAGAIGYVRYGRAIRYRPADVAAWIAANVVNAQGGE